MRNVYGRYLKDLSSWRRMAVVAWAPPDDPAIYGSIEIDFTKAREYMLAEAERTGVHMTANHVVVKAMAETLRRHPDCNGLIRRNKIFLRDHIDISVLVAIDAKDSGDQKADLSETIIRDADQKDLAQISREVQAGAHSVRKHEDKFVEHTKKLLDFFPPWIVKRALKIMAWLEYQWNIDLTRFGVPRDPFGAFMVTSVGSLGLKQAYAPIVPFSGVVAVISVGRVEERPVVRNGEIVARPILPLYATIDHRMIDGFQGAKLAKTIQEIMEDPWRHLGAH